MHRLHPCCISTCTLFKTDDTNFLKFGFYFPSATDNALLCVWAHATFKPLAPVRFLWNVHDKAYHTNLTMRYSSRVWSHQRRRDAFHSSPFHERLQSYLRQLSPFYFSIIIMSVQLVLRKHIRSVSSTKSGKPLSYSSLFAWSCFLLKKGSKEAKKKRKLWLAPSKLPSFCRWKINH